MKFGKRMQESLFYLWADKYVDYNKLKRCIKSNCCGNEFVSLIHEELDRVEEFFVSKEAELSQSLMEVESSGMSTIDADFVIVCSHVERLREFVLVNYLAACKIIKKHDKVNAACPIASKAIATLKIRKFCRSSKLKESLHRMEGLLAHYFVSPEAPFWSGTCHLCARQCLNVLSLQCGHRFCWGCFRADVVPACECCSACGASTGLRPENFEVCALGVWVLHPT
eukprot:NODE_1974_length_1339_cov_26.025581_g1791_i0.p1 GENE.NODE_1974_length_1339_cov_26.025581_g1791_i0~~NODE_1974_length_1339_cov_26.025581_g1791_i0.p1  ORF type:complete len:225 (+),score=31.47 NODE_1974_length_1339_cov_26.025581_g1791_i0:104-778(+)